MTVIQILLLIAGAVIFALGFFIPDGKDNGSAFTVKGKKEYTDKLHEISENELKEVSRNIRDVIDEEVVLAQNNSARSLEKLTNEKIMAINEYGKTVIDEIERNHKEVVFMYDMLNNKSTDLKNTIRKAENIEKNNVKPDKAVKPQNKDAVKRPAPKAEPSENIHIPKMFAAPKDKNGKPDLPVSPAVTPKDNDAASFVTVNYGKDVVRLHKEGISDVDIAKRLGIGVGEVRLAISLSEAGGSDAS